nr:DUF1441 family protein [Halorhodospira sp. 9622]
MPSPAQIGDANLFSINRLSQVTGMARETITKRLNGVQPAGMKNGHPVYHFREAGPALYGESAGASSADPEEMTPSDRDRWYASEIKRLEYEKSLGRLIPAEEARQAWSEALKSMMLALETLTDLVERDAGLNPEQARVIEATVDRVRRQLYTELGGSDDEDG